MSVRSRTAVMVASLLAVGTGVACLGMVRAAPATRAVIAADTVPTTEPPTVSPGAAIAIDVSPQPVAPGESVTFTIHCEHQEPVLGGGYSVSIDPEGNSGIGEWVEAMEGGIGELVVVWAAPVDLSPGTYWVNGWCDGTDVFGNGSPAGLIAPFAVGLPATTTTTAVDQGALPPTR